MSALVSAESKFGNYTPANHHPHSMFEYGSELTAEICQRSVNRSINENFDFNAILANKDNQYDDWTDKTFSGKYMIQWDDMNVHPDNDQNKILYDHSTTFRKMSDVFSQDEYSLFGRNSISPKDAIQGALGDCWIIAAASAVATDPERIKNIFLTQNLNNAGIYALRLYLLGVPVTVSVDEKLAF